MGQSTERKWPSWQTNSYASFERGMIWLRAERPNGWHEIALDLSVYHALTEYAATI
jgi:hypothetical protein